VSRLLKQQWQEQIQSNEFEYVQALGNVSVVETYGSM
jgi:hypothetical protein